MQEETMLIMINDDEIGEVENTDGFFYTVAFAERTVVIDVREVEYKIL